MRILARTKNILHLQFHRATKLGVYIEEIAPHHIFRLMKVQWRHCNGCRITLTLATYTLDHIIPLSLGGAHAPGNLQLLCPTCNFSKNSRLNWKCKRPVKNYTMLAWEDFYHDHNPDSYD